MSVYLSAKFQVSSITLMSFRQGGGNLTPPPQNEAPKKHTQIRVKMLILVVDISSNYRLQGRKIW